MDHQNWDPQVIRKSAQAIRADALRKGEKQTVERRSDMAQHLAKVEREDFVPFLRIPFVIWKPINEHPLHENSRRLIVS